MGLRPDERLRGRAPKSLPIHPPAFSIAAARATIRVAVFSRGHPMRRILLAPVVMAILAGCTWVHMAPGASAVRVISAGVTPAGCEKRGEVAVSVKDRLGFYERNDLRVREELETLARNEAPGLEADTIQPLAAPNDGEQRFAAWRCGARAAGPARPGTDASTSAETYPVRN